MIPVVTPAQMRAIDAAAADPVDVLIERAGAAVARAAVGLLGGTYGRTVVVIAGKGNNGADGRVAARLLTERGVRVAVVDALGPPATIGDADLVIDAAFGTGMRGTWQAPDVGQIPVLAVDIPSGVDALTGAAAGPVLGAVATVTFAALKPGLLVGAGRALAGEVVVADIGLETSSADTWLVTPDDVAQWWPRRRADSHKWHQAVRIIAGSESMTGAAVLCAAAAQAAGAGMVQLASPAGIIHHAPVESVQRPLPADGWADAALDDLARIHAVAIGPGLGRSPGTIAAVGEVVSRCQAAMVIDGDGLTAVAGAAGDFAAVRSRNVPTVLTPHDGEYTALVGSAPGDDRVAAARRLSAAANAVVLLKGQTTVVAEPGGRALISVCGDQRLATAGSGDVLTGLIVAALAGGADPWRGAAAAAYLHGLAALVGPRHTMVAGDLVAHLDMALDIVVGQR